MDGYIQVPGNSNKNLKLKVYKRKIQNINFKIITINIYLLADFDPVVVWWIIFTYNKINKIQQNRIMTSSGEFKEGARGACPLIAI